MLKNGDKIKLKVNITKRLTSKQIQALRKKQFPRSTEQLMKLKSKSQDENRRKRNKWKKISCNDV